MTPPMAPSRNDWAPKSRIFMISERCPTIAIWSTSTKAAIRVTSLSPNSGFCSKSIGISKQECGYQGQGAQYERHRHQLGNAEQAHLGAGGLDQHDAAAQDQE